MHTFWCTKSLKKTLSFGAKSRKQRVGIFLAFQIYGSKGSYRQNIENRGVTSVRLPAVPFRNRAGWSRSRLESASAVGLSKIVDYLIDNLCVHYVIVSEGVRSSRKWTGGGPGSELGISPRMISPNVGGLSASAAQLRLLRAAAAVVPD
jgi:hypothetical protein